MEIRIPFNIPPYVGSEMEYLRQACEINHKICGDGPFTKRCKAWVEKRTKTAECLMTTSGTSALEMAAHLSHIQPGDEVIMPSYTFCSTADAFVLKKAVPVFVDIRPDTMNLDETKIENAITDRTRAIAAVHYAGVACEMDTIMEIARRYHLTVVEDAAQGVMSTYKGKALGTIGDFGCYSFHETKNYSMGEGGAILIRDPERVSAEEINEARLARWNQYYRLLTPLAGEGRIELPVIPQGCVHNAHMFYIKTKDLEERQALIGALKEQGILAVFHYIPLHSSPAGKKFGRFHGEDRYTTKESERLLRLPMYYSLTEENVNDVVSVIEEFYRGR